MNREVDVKALISHIVRGDGADKCRICLADTSEGRVFLGDTVMMHGDKAVTLAELLETITGVEVEASSILPNKICSQCNTQIMNFVPFIQLCTESVKHWKDITLYLNDISIPKQTRSLYVIASRGLHTYTSSKSSKTVKDAIRNLGHKFKQRKTYKTVIKGSVRKNGRKRTCPECDTSFSNTISFNKHMKNIGKKFCVHCHTLLDLDTYGEHLKTHQLTIYPCKYCSEAFGRHSSLIVHLSKHKGNHVCVECKENFATGRHLAVHLNKHKSVSCTSCNRKFSNRSCYLFHSRNCANIRETSTSYVCDYCKKEYRMKNSLKLHIICKHMAVKPYQCFKCGKRFFSRLHLEEHDNTHNKVTDRYICVICGLKFSTRRGHERHNKRHHSGCEITSADVKTSKYKCPICMKEYRQKRSLKSHLSIKHDVIDVVST